jgi:hypothetical protein
MGSLIKRPYFHIGHQEEFKDGMPSDAIEGELSHLEANPIFSSSMPTLDVFSEPISLNQSLTLMISLMLFPLSLLISLGIH